MGTRMAIYPRKEFTRLTEGARFETYTCVVCGTNFEAQGMPDFIAYVDMAAGKNEIHNHCSTCFEPYEVMYALVK